MSRTVRQAKTTEPNSKGPGIIHLRKQTGVQASPREVFDLVSDLSRHAELAGSGEVQRVRKLTEGPVSVGTRFEADEDIPLRKGNVKRRRFVAHSEVLEYDPPRVISWKSTPPGGGKPPLIQWWFRLSPEGRSTRVVHELKITADGAGPVTRFIMGNLARLLRKGPIERGMEQTLANLRQMPCEQD